MRLGNCPGKRLHRAPVDWSRVACGPKQRAVAQSFSHQPGNQSNIRLLGTKRTNKPVFKGKYRPVEVVASRTDTSGIGAGKSGSVQARCPIRQASKPMSVSLSHPVQEKGPCPHFRMDVAPAIVREFPVARDSHKQETGTAAPQTIWCRLSSSSRYAQADTAWRIVGYRPGAPKNWRIRAAVHMLGHPVNAHAGLPTGQACPPQLGLFSAITPRDPYPASPAADSKVRL